MFNRTVLILRPQKPFKEWLAHMERTLPKDERTPMSDVEHDRNVYLLPPSWHYDRVEDYLSACYETLFAHELSEWTEDVTQWPARSDFATFKQWFTWEHHTMMVDIGGGPFIDDDTPPRSFWSRLKFW
jgi:hypothetical protein